MCSVKQPEIKAAPIVLAAPKNTEAGRLADMEARLRRMRSGAAASILTSPVGIPGDASMKLGDA